MLNDAKSAKDHWNGTGRSIVAGQYFRVIYLSYSTEISIWRVCDFQYRPITHLNLVVAFFLWYLALDRNVARAHAPGGGKLGLVKLEHGALVGHFTALGTGWRRLLSLRHDRIIKTLITQTETQI